MRTFDVLRRDCPIFGPHLLEASAGTGKTFSIEHAFIRLILESDDIDAEQILAVTFTRAATRDLKQRIRSSLEEARLRIGSGKTGWEYLDPFLGSQEALKKLEEAVIAFDRAQVYTIHGFCFRMLQEFAFEAELGFSLPDPDRKNGVPERLYREAKRFLEGGMPTGLLCPEQMGILLRNFESMDAFVSALLKRKASAEGRFFSEYLNRFRLLWDGAPLESADSAALFEQSFSQYKISGFTLGNLKSQAEALGKGLEDPEKAFRTLVWEKGSLFAFLDPSNRKKNAKSVCPPFFDWAAKTFGPLVEEAADAKKLFGCLKNAWEKAAEPLLNDEQWFEPDEILKRMRMAVERAPFAAAVRKKYKAVVIDEFQDTDPLQWEIFKILFLNAELRAYYLVGDPKQSIYRFRKADIYTYYEAKQSVGHSALFRLDTNYRSSSRLIEALNALFARGWLDLPKLRQTIACLPVESRSKANSDFSDGKGALHVLRSESFDEGWLPYAVSEIERLIPEVGSPAGFAILVKDRYQGEAALRLLQSRCIPAVAKSHIPLGKTLAFQAVREFFETLAHSRDPSMRRIVGAGPFQTVPLDASLAIVEEEGLVPLCRNLLAASSDDLAFEKDLKQIVEMMLEWEAESGFSFPGISRFLDALKDLGVEEGGRRNLETDAEAVQVLTMHASKGLEFDVVFALGIGSRPPEGEEEAEEAAAESLRQLYVAMTRAKRRLYIPLPPAGESNKTSSPMELFCQKLEAQEGPILPYFARVPNTTVEEISEPFLLPHADAKETEKVELADKQPVPEWPASLLQSFTSLARPEKGEPVKEEAPSVGYTVHTIPKGVETGILIHQIFERLFASSFPVWKDESSVKTLVSRELRGTFLEPWESAIQEMLWNTLNLQLLGQESFALVDLSPGDVQAELEFLYSEPPHFIVGFIDLVFRRNGKFYFVDWKTNWLGADDAAYRSLESAMSEHDYWLQAKLYAEGLRRHVKRFYMEPFEELFGGAVYLFLRGGVICHFIPN